MLEKRAQISTEYLILVSFITVVIITILGVAAFYTSKVQDTVKFDEIEKSAKKIIFSAETTFYNGAPAKATTEIYLPDGINSITISENHLIFNVSSSTGNNIVAYKSSVPISGNLPSSPGLKLIKITAEAEGVSISGA